MSAACVTIRPEPFAAFFPVALTCGGVSFRLRADGRQRVALVALDLLREEEAELLLSEEERQHAAQFHHSKRRKEWLGGRMAAKAALLRLHEPDEFRRLTILPDRHGRPAVSGPAADCSLSLSITHSGGYAAALAMHGSSCGIDLQAASAKLPSLTSCFTSAAELELFAALPPETGSYEARLTMLWAVKEAVKKSVLADQPAIFSGIEVRRIIAAGDRSWQLDCAVCRSRPQIVTAHELAPYVLALTAA